MSLKTLLATIASNSKPILYLKIAEVAEQRDVGRKIARIDPEVAVRFRISAGDALELSSLGKKSTVLSWPAKESDRGRGLIRADGYTRNKLDVGINDTIEIRKVESKDAKSITFAPTEPLRIVGGEEYLAEYLNGALMTKGDTIPINVMGQRIDLVVVSTNPTGPVIIKATLEDRLPALGEIIPAIFTGSTSSNQVQIVQKWNGTSKISLDILYSKFLAYLIDQGSKVVKHNNNKTHTILSENSKSAYILQKNCRLLRKKSIDWIEQLLQTPLPEHRKYRIWRIFAPYFINVKHLSVDDSYDKIYQWLDRCNELKQLDFDPATKINDSLNRATNTGYLPISFDNPLKEPRTLKNDNRELYDIINV